MFEFTISPDNPFYHEVRMKGYPFLYARFHGRKLTFTDKIISLDYLEILVKEFKEFLAKETR